MSSEAFEDGGLGWAVPRVLKYASEDVGSDSEGGRVGLDGLEGGCG